MKKGQWAMRERKRLKDKPSSIAFFKLLSSSASSFLVKSGSVSVQKVRLKSQESKQKNIISRNLQALQHIRAVPSSPRQWEGKRRPDRYSPTRIQKFYLLSSFAKCPVCGGREASKTPLSDVKTKTNGTFIKFTLAAFCWVTSFKLDCVDWVSHWQIR